VKRNSTSFKCTVNHTIFLFQLIGWLTIIWLLHVVTNLLIPLAIQMSHVLIATLP
jgi:hypothetical protein